MSSWSGARSTRRRPEPSARCWKVTFAGLSTSISTLPAPVGGEPKGATAIWGIFACVVATYAATLGSLIEVVNRFGSFFYGSILGVFLLALVPRARGNGAFVGLLVGMTAVGFVNFGTEIAYLWQNIIGAAVVFVVGLMLSFGEPSEQAS